MNFWQKILLVIVLFFYIYFRITPIIHQTVPYTYDQGRDFLKVKEIVENKNFTLIGPTTGLEGIFHGVWIYYFLSIPYILFSGNPIGFYYFFFLINLIVNLLFFNFLRKKFNFNLAILFLLTTSISKYFINEAFSPSNDHLVSIFILGFIYFSYLYFLKKEKKYLFLTMMFSGFILESEFAFGLFLIPSTFFSFLIIEKKSFIKKIPLFFISIIPPSLPRFIFEIKHNFLQTKNFLKYLFSNQSNNLEFTQIIKERLILFFNYINDIFTYKYLSIIFLLLFIFGLITKKIKLNKNNLWIKFNLLILSLIFLLLIIYKKDPFYPYYLNGIQYIFLIIALFFLNQKNSFLKLFNIFLIIFFLIINLINFKNSIFKKNIPLLGLRADNEIINYFVKNESKDYFCLRIYTPPVIPYTYQYLLQYYVDKKQIKYPKGDFYKGQCYFIIDKEPYEFRLSKWREENTPENAKLIKKISFENGSTIELWKEN
ncbi:MAG: hypothetical protein KatS3mg092_0147 [Patescibacteria group bacterium]|nr:MAG: hypothetical protein KatS3mg092_0147 [Patescibacteria group bacterium]